MRRLALVFLSLSAILVVSAATVTPAYAATTVTHKWVNIDGSGKCLNAKNASTVNVTSCVSTDTQKWAVTTLSNKKLKIVSVTQPNKCLDSNYDRAVYLYTCNGGTYQQWEPVVKATNRTVLRNAETKVCLDNNGSSVYMYPCNYGDFERWAQ